MAQLNQQQLIMPGIIIMIQFIKYSSTWQLIAPLDFRVQEEEQGELCYFCGRNPIKYIILHNWYLLNSSQLLHISNVRIFLLLGMLCGVWPMSDYIASYINKERNIVIVKKFHSFLCSCLDFL